MVWYSQEEVKKGLLRVKYIHIRGKVGCLIGSSKRRYVLQEYSRNNRMLGNESVRSIKTKWL